MKIITYNVNGLRQRISQYGSLLKLLDSFDADIICFQETKLRRQEMTSDLVMDDGYESFFSCTHTVERGRTGYSGVATFCRVRAAFLSTEVVLPVAAEEGFTGVLGDCSGDGKDGDSKKVSLGMEEFQREELVKVDGEGRCVITDHGHFEYCRCEKLLEEERRILIVGDLNIAPTAMDRCDASPDFEHNEFRRWFRSLLTKSGGKFSHVFRAKHPDRTDAYTCWPTNTGAEQFNYGSRIDHILCAGSCMHEDCESQEHDFLTCHVRECDILSKYKRWKPGSMSRFRWKGSVGIKLEGSDHAPVSVSLEDIHDINQHSTPSLSSRYLPMICGLQQSLVSIFMKRQAVSQVESNMMSSSISQETTTISKNREDLKKSCSTFTLLRQCTNEVCSLNVSNSEVSETYEHSEDFPDEACLNNTITSSAVRCENIDNLPRGNPMKKARKGQSSQLSIKSFFQKSPSVGKEAETSYQNESLNQSEGQDTSHNSRRKPAPDNQSSNPEDCHLTSSSEALDHDNIPDDSWEKTKNNYALMEWQRIQQLMQKSIPLCKGHKEPCVSRVVKKAGPTFGHRFYVCARAEGPASNPDANCGYFKWASSKFRHKQ